MAFSPDEISQILEEFFRTVGTRQYIGARYVPIFGRRDEESIQWDNSAPYEPLTIVLYQGNSYTSRQYVPAGIDILNEAFWALTGNYNAQIEAYREEVLRFDGRITAAEEMVSDFGDMLPSDQFSDTNTVAAAISANTDAITTVTNRIDTLTKSGFISPNAFDEMLGFFDAIDSGSIGIIPEGEYTIGSTKLLDETQLMANAGTVTGGNIVIGDSKPVFGDSEFFGHMLIPSTAQATQNGYVISAACIDTLRNQLIVALSGSSDDGGFILAEVDMHDDFNYGAEHQFTGMTTHCNSLTYNPTTDCFYIPARPTEDVVYEINASTFVLNRSINIDFGDIIRSFAYDATNRVYFAIGATYVKVYDASFNLIKTINTSYSDVESLLDGFVSYHQDACVIDGNLVQLVALTKGGASGSGGIFSADALVQYRYDGSLSVGTYEQNPYITGEGECLFTDGRYAYIMLSSGRFCPVIRVATKPVHAFNVADNARILKNGDDMNDMRVKGVYYCATNEIRNTLANVPAAITGSFSMEVLPFYTGNYIYQIFAASNGGLWVRRFLHSNQTWTELGTFAFYGRTGSLGNDFYGYENYTAKYLHGFASIAIQASDITWIAEGNMHVSQDLSIPLPSYNGSSITHYAASASAGASNAFVTATSFRVSGNNLLFRFLSPVAYAGRAITLRVMLDLTYS